jgi:hypothetical protein
MGTGTQKKGTTLLNKIKQSGVLVYKLPLPVQVDVLQTFPLNSPTISLPTYQTGSTPHT